VARRYPSAAVPAYIAAAGIAAAQVPRCAHYPSDIAAGVLVGLAAEAAAAARGARPDWTIRPGAGCRRRGGRGAAVTVDRRSAGSHVRVPQ
jgi:membrane-associated phospholipid phosphatase